MEEIGYSKIWPQILSIVIENGKPEQVRFEIGNISGEMAAIKNIGFGTYDKIIPGEMMLNLKVTLFYNGGKNYALTEGNISSVGKTFKEVSEKWNQEINKLKEGLSCGFKSIFRRIYLDERILKPCRSCGLIIPANKDEYVCYECAKPVLTICEGEPTKRQALEKILKQMGAKPEYILEFARFDYFFKEYKLAIELDDKSHRWRIDKDNKRDRYFYHQHGIFTARFTYEEIEENIQNCVYEIKRLLGLQQQNLLHGSNSQRQEIKLVQ